MLSTVLRYAKARPKPGVMNKTEAAYAQHLEHLRRIGLIKEFWYEAISLRLGKDCHFRPDFLVLSSEMVLEVHEVKGFKRKPNGSPGFYVREDALVKTKAAASKFPFRFVVVCQTPKKDGGYWHLEEL